MNRTGWWTADRLLARPSAHKRLFGEVAAIRCPASFSIDLVDPRPRKVLRGRWYLNPAMPAFFPNRSNGLHPMGVVEETDRDAGYIRIFGAPHENRCPTVGAEELIECATQIGRARELLEISCYLNLLVWVISRFTEWRSGSLLAGDAMAGDNGNRRPRHFGPQLSALTGSFHRSGPSSCAEIKSDGPVSAKSG